MATKVLYRLTVATDTEANVTDKITFNSSKDITVENAFMVQIQRTNQMAVADNQAAEQDLGEKQPAGTIEDNRVLTCFFSKRNGNLSDGNNAFLALLNSWSIDAKTNTNWVNGRFGFTDNDDHTKDVTPVRTGTSQKGLILESIVYTSNLGENIENCTITLKMSKGDGT